MANLARQEIDHFDHQAQVIKNALRHFSRSDGFAVVEAVGRYAFSDDILFESFELWSKKEIDDEAFMFQVHHFFKTKDRPALSSENRDLTGNRAAIDLIKKSADLSFAKQFARKLGLLANHKKLTTNEKLGTFLGVSAEQARQLLQGEHKPQRKTILKVSEAFGVPPEEFLEDL